MDKKIVLFEDQKVRRCWDEKQEKWYFSVIDIIAILADSLDPRTYWKVLKNRLKAEGNETVTNCNQLKMMAKDGKDRLTDVADLETLFRIIQTIPSPKAEPFKLWLAKVGQERIEEISDPEKSINRARENWKTLGYDNEWIQRRMMGQEVRNKLTDYWNTHEIEKKREYAILTNIIHMEWSDLSIAEHKKLKKLDNQNLRDHMTEPELVFTMLAELSTRKIAETHNATGFNKNADACVSGGKIAKNARLELEEKTHKKIISGSNFLSNKKGNKKLPKTIKGLK